MQLGCHEAAGLWGVRSMAVSDSYLHRLEKSRDWAELLARGYSAHAGAPAVRISLSSISRTLTCAPSLRVSSAPL